MDSWTAPNDINEWIRRIFSIRPMAVTLLICLLGISELRFDWAERMVGRFLATTNTSRPESGAIWEKGHRTATALQTLDKIITDKQTIQREAREARSFSQIARTLAKGRDVILAASHFQTLYNALPPERAGELLSPYTLIRMHSQGQWDRTFFETADQGFSVYFLNRDNRVLHQLQIDTRLLDRIERGESVRNESLDHLPQFSERIYDAERFFAVLEEMPEDIRRNIVPWPENLLKAPGRIRRVGISDEVLSGYIEIGLEMENTQRTHVLLFQGRDWAVGRLRAVLEGEQFQNEIEF
ncbi:MAG: hypothetical protein JJV98_13315 [Desulfosarcina sp.]|nr:hypothetical protein [Desulfobacterales bacterium]